MTISEKLKRLYNAQKAIKDALVAKGIATSSTNFSELANLITNNLSVDPPTITLTLRFTNNLYYQTTVGSKSVYATGGSYNSSLLINDVEYFSLLKGKAVINGTSQPTVTISVQVPQNTKITIKHRLYIGPTASNPGARRCYDSTTNLYNTNYDVKTITTGTTAQTVTFTVKGDSG